MNGIWWLDENKPVVCGHDTILVGASRHASNGMQNALMHAQMHAAKQVAHVGRDPASQHGSPCWVDAWMARFEVNLGRERSVCGEALVVGNRRTVSPGSIVWSVQWPLTQQRSPSLSPACPSKGARDCVSPSSDFMSRYPLLMSQLRACYKWVRDCDVDGRTKDKGRAGSLSALGCVRWWLLKAGQGE
jgi:hypothetical protein